MAQPTKAQRDYAKGRLESIFKSKRDKIESLYGYPKKTISSMEAWKLVKQNKVPLKKKTPSPYGNWHSIFDFSEYEWPAGLSPKGKELASKLEKEKQKAIDELMLGDAEEMLSCIKKYEGKD